MEKGTANRAMTLGWHPDVVKSGKQAVLRGAPFVSQSRKQAFGAGRAVPYFSPAGKIAPAGSSFAANGFSSARALLAAGVFSAVRGFSDAAGFSVAAGFRAIGNAFRIAHSKPGIAAVLWSSPRRTFEFRVSPAYLRAFSRVLNLRTPATISRVKPRRARSYRATSFPPTYNNTRASRRRLFCA